MTRTAALALLAVAVVMTWPLARLWSPEIPNQPDASFNVWRLAWVAHQLREDPTRLFEANIFSPAAHTLAYSDAMPLLGFAGAPLMWVGIHPFAVHNLLIVAAFWSASYFTYRLCLRLTSNQWASVLGGLVGGYAPYRFGHVSHIELLWTAFLPLGFSALLTLHEQPSLRASLRLALCVVLQTLCSIYYGIYFAIYLALASVALAIRNRGVAVSRVAIALAMAAAIGLVILLPYVLMYRAASTLVEHRTSRGNCAVQRHATRLPARFARTRAAVATFGARPGRAVALPRPGGDRAGHRRSCGAARCGGDSRGPGRAER